VSAIATELVGAGLRLITFSKLAAWDQGLQALSPAEKTQFEGRQGHKRLDPVLGRLICWVCFSLGTEYLLKRACISRGLSIESTALALRLPDATESIADWTPSALAKALSAQENVPKYKTLGELPVSKLVPKGPDREFVRAACRLFASAIRNRDAHGNARDVRAMHFHLVPTLFVPALNKVIEHLDSSVLKAATDGFKPLAA
jgi:hypothetical protein